MSFDEGFENIYENDSKLPESISEVCSVFSCLEYSDDSQVYILMDHEGKSFVPETGSGYNSLSIENEYRIYERRYK